MMNTLRKLNVKSKQWTSPDPPDVDDKEDLDDDLYVLLREARRLELGRKFSPNPRKERSK